MKKRLLEAALLCAIVMVVSYAFAQAWTKKISGGFGFSMAMSADGQIIMSVGSSLPVVSTNRGATWITPVFTTGSYPECVASSADGTKMVASGNYALYDNCGFFISKDSGLTWVQTSTSNGAVAISADGCNVFIAINEGFIYQSKNFGTNWVATGASSNNWSCLALSPDGTKLAAGATGDTIYTSTNSGQTWAPTQAPSNSWFSIAMSSDGSHLIGTPYGGAVYISTNSGSNWTPVGISGQSVASSADGSKLVIVAPFNSSGNYEPVYTSTNYGTSWMSTNIMRDGLFGTASSPDGNEIVVGGNGDTWIYQVAPSPQLNLSSSGNNLVFSWLIPSTNFVLQQNSDLTTANWTTLTNTPSINFASLSNVLTLPSSNSIGFYRLAFP